jgi:hypothetical protein
MTITAPAAFTRAANGQVHPDYERLPETLKAMVTPEEYAWLDYRGQARMVEDICYPDWEEM